MKMSERGAIAEGVTLPQISINGTSPSSLLDDYLKCRSAIMAARRVLAEHGPNGRDYQHDPSKFPAARAEHEARLSSLDTMETELLALAEHASAHVRA